MKDFFNHVISIVVAGIKLFFYLCIVRGRQSVAPPGSSNIKERE